MHRIHHMPFGPELGADGTVFRLWAPAAHHVDLLIESGARRSFAMTPEGGGWFVGVAADVGDGCRYRFCIDGNKIVPDPTSRFQPDDVHGASQVVDPRSFDWDDEQWPGRKWYEAVIYELHVGTFTPEGTFAAAQNELARLARLGITAVELMPVADFPGARNWGYDGVLPFAPDSRYGEPNDLKRFVAAAHRLGLMVFIDVVYNHFGPEGNYLAAYAPAFFSAQHTDWGDGLNFSPAEARPVRDFFINNALYWMREFNVDGLRLDAVHAIHDDSAPHVLEELAARVRRAVPAGRHFHLVLENDDNAARYLARGADGRPAQYDAQWNDDFHHALHVILTGETDGYYADYAANPIDDLGMTLTQGFRYQGRWSQHRQRDRGEPSGHLPPTAFVNFLQNHDQVGNRAFGERLSMLVPGERLATAVAILLLAPSPPLLFMGEEWGASTPFAFFCDFSGDLATAVREGRRREFARFPQFSAPEMRAAIPDPNDDRTFAASQLDCRVAARPEASMLYEQLLHTRHREIIPRLAGAAAVRAGYEVERGLLIAWWQWTDGSALEVIANLSVDAARLPQLAPGWRKIWGRDDAGGSDIAPWTVIWRVRDGA